MEWKVGEIKQVNGEWYQCVKAPKFGECDGCAFDKNGCPFINDKTCDDLLGYCSYDWREDNEEVIFKKLEKVGEPIVFKDKLLQKMKTPVAIGCEQCAINNKGCAILYEKCHTGELYVKIKQNKEDMEENTNVEQTPLEKLVIDFFNNRITDMEFERRVSELYVEHSNSEKIGKNLKEFDINLAKAGKPVCTRDGRKARIICFDRKRTWHQEFDYPIVALISEDGYNESLGSYTKDGLCSPGVDCNIDLMMLSEKKEGWVNVYKERIYKTKEEAIKANNCDRVVTYVDTIKIEYEE